MPMHALTWPPVCPALPLRRRRSSCRSSWRSPPTLSWSAKATTSGVGPPPARWDSTSSCLLPRLLQADDRGLLSDLGLPAAADGCRVPAVRGDAAGYGDDWRTLVLQVRC